MFLAPCGSGGRGWGVVGGCPPHMCTCMCTHTHAHVVNMIISCKWLLPLDFWGIPGNSLWYHMRAHVCECACVCMCVGAHSHHPPPPSTHSPTPPGWTLRIIQNSIVLGTNWDISILFEDLKSVETSPPMGGCIVWWMGGWVGGLMGGVRSKH